MSRRSPFLAVTPGDPGGIGPEILWKTIRARKRTDQAFDILCVGARRPFEDLGAEIIEVTLEELVRGDCKPPRKKQPFVWLLAAPSQAPKTKGSRQRAFLPGFQSGWSIETATRLVLDGIADALVTGPISKERLQRGGYPYPGHTEMLAKLCGAKEVTMMLANEQLRITLVTVHTALRDVPREMTREKIRRCAQHTADHLRHWWGIEKPHIAVAALNPHAGENGLFGREEIEVIGPEIKSLQRGARGKVRFVGPLPADTLFAKHVSASPKERFDAVVCMYHDQGLVPVKLLDFPKTVNVTLGLPIIRTSVDHGVGFDIAGTGRADPSSLQSAIKLALSLVKTRRPGRAKNNLE